MAGLTACARDGAPERQKEHRRFFTSADLDDIVLPPTEAPPETEFIGELSGRFTLEELWPSSCCPGPHEDFDAAGFRAAYGSWFQRPGHSEDPIDARPGFELVSSTVVLFSDAEGASEAMRSWIEYFKSPGVEPLSTDGLGEEAAGFIGSPDAPAETLVFYFWRIGRLLLALRASGGTGTIGVENIRPLADRMDRRAS